MASLFLKKGFYLSGCIGSYMWHAGTLASACEFLIAAWKDVSSPTRGRSQASFTGSLES